MKVVTPSRNEPENARCRQDGRSRRAPDRMTPMLAAYAQYRRSHCGVAERTLKRDFEIARAFLCLLRRRNRSARQASVADLDAFVTQAAQRVSTRTVVDSCSALRSFLRFLRVTGRIRHDLALSVMAPRFQADRPPRALPWADVRRILRAIRRRQPPGKRDFAMLLMMATYGFGAAEVLGLDFEAVDWKTAVLHARRPKTGQVIELPLLPPIAHALATYIQDERPASAP
jgi:integrase/recombinase XerD